MSITNQISSKSLVQFVLGLVAVVLVAELALQVAGDRLVDAHPAGSWPTRHAAVQAREMETLAQTHGTIDIVVVGASHVRNGLDPSVVQAATGRTTYNAAMNAAWPVVQEHWLVREVVPRLEPSLVVFGLSAIDFNSRHSADLPARFERFAADQDSRYRSLEEHLAGFSNTFEQRHRLKHVLTSPGALLEQTEVQEPEPQLLGFRPRGQSSDFEGELSAVQEAFQTYDLSAADVSAMRTMIGELLAADIEVILVMMPLPDVWDEVISSTGADVSSYYETVRSLAEEFGVELYDYDDAVPDEHFSDYTHLKPSGAELLSRALGERIAVN